MASDSHSDSPDEPPADQSTLDADAGTDTDAGDSDGYEEFITVADGVAEDGTTTPLRLPVVELLTGRGFITGKSGSGKSNTASVVVEQLLDAGFATLIVDTDGEYYGLKEKYEILHVGGDDECDYQVGPEHAEKVASLALDQNVPIILDVSSYLDESDANELIREVARSLFAREKKAKQPFLMVVEEVHEYIPEGGGLDETGKMLIKVAKRGRKHGLGIAGISQRPADVKKDFITQANWLVWHRLTWDNDTNVVKRVIDADHADAVEDLGDGEAFLQTDWSDPDVQHVQFRRKQTFDGGATPGLDDFERPELKGLDDSLVDELEDISDAAASRRDRVAQLEREVERKEERIEELERELEVQDAFQSSFERMVESSLGSGADASGGTTVDTIKAEVMEVREEKQAVESDLEDAHARIEELEATNADLRETVDRLEAELEQRESRIEHAEEIETQHEALRDDYDAMQERVETAVALLAGDQDAADVDAALIDVATDADPDAVDNELREELDAKRERVAHLQDEVDRLETAVEQLREGGTPLSKEFQSKLEFVRSAPVSEAIETAASKTELSDDHVWDVVTFLVDEDRAPTSAITPAVDISSSGVRKILSKLSDHRVVANERDGNTPYYYLNIEGMEELIRQQQRKAELADLKDNVRPSA